MSDLLANDAAANDPAANEPAANGPPARPASGNSVAVRVGAGLLAVSIAAAALAAWRWERSAELLPGLPRPNYSRLADTRTDAARNTCTFDLVVEGQRLEVRRDYDALLLAAGWETVTAAGDRVNYRRGGQVARVAVRIPTATEPGWSRVRVNIGPCEVGRS